MPWKSEWVEPEVAVQHGGVTVYRTYKEDDTDQGYRNYWFTTDPQEGDYGSPPAVFDVRYLQPEVTDENVDDYKNDPAEIQVLKHAIDQGLLKQEGVV